MTRTLELETCHAVRAWHCGISGFDHGVASAQQVSPNGVKTLAPEGAIKTTGTWALGTRAGDFVYVAGMRGIDPKTNTLVQATRRASGRASST